MNGKMCGRSVAWLIFAGFLSSCSSPTPSVSPGEGPPVLGPLAGQPREQISEPASTKRGNCLELTGSSGGVPYDYCYYTFSKPMCTTVITDCRNITGKCSTTNPVPNPPPC